MSLTTDFNRVLTGPERRFISTLTTPAMISGLSLLDERSYRAGLMGANEAGLYKPTNSPTR